MQILELLSETGALSVSQAAALMKQNRSTTHRFFATLETLGYVLKDKDSRYRLSLKSFVIGNRTTALSSIQSLAKPYMEELALRHGETVHLVQMVNLDVVTINVVTGRNAIRFDTHIGQRVPAHQVSTGKALLAFQSQAGIRQYLDKTGFTPRDPQNTVSRACLEKELQSIKKARFAIDDEGWNTGLRSVAMPIFDTCHLASHALGVSGPCQRMTREKIAAMQKDLETATGSLTRAAGGPYQGALKC